MGGVTAGHCNESHHQRKHSTKHSNYERCNVREARQYWDITKDASAGLTCVGNGVWLSAECRLRGLLD